MKNHWKTVAVLFGTLLLLGACTDLLKPPVSSDPVTAGKGRLVINIESPARTPLPSGNFTRYVLRFSGPPGYSHGDVEGTSGFTVDLEPGSWTITVDAYAGTELSGQGSADVTVDPDLVTPVAIKIGLYETTTQGTLKYTISYPAAGTDHDYSTQTLTVTTPEGAIAETKPLGNGNTGTVLLAAGDYFVTAEIQNFKQRTSALRTDAVHIYAGRETHLAYTIDAAEFTAVVPVTGTISLTGPGGVTVTGRAVRAYEDSDCTTFLTSSASLAVSGDQPFTLSVPARYINVYFRQEIEAGGVWIPGARQSATIPLNPSGPLSAGSFGDTFYAVTTSTYTGGTVTANPTAAIAGTTVTLTVTPDPDYAFNTETFTVKRTDTNAHLTLSGSGPYTFTMPQADVTVSADFAAGAFRYVTPGGSGTKNGFTWANASDDLQAMIDAVFADIGGGDKIVHVAAGTYQPKYKPNSAGASTPDPGDRDCTFILRQGVILRGGYDGGGDYIADADRQAHFNADGTVKSLAYETILSGDIGAPGTDFDNAYHVVLAVDIPDGSPTVLDGFTITGGNANGGGNLTVNGDNIPQVNGGGMCNWNSSPALRNVTIKNNRSPGTSTAGTGGGMYNNNSSPVLNAVTISSNTASKAGGGMYNYWSSPELTDVTVSGNSVSATTSGDGMGGGIYNGNSSSPVLLRVRITGNTVSNTMSGSAPQGGGIYSASSSAPVLINVLISGNKVSCDGVDNSSGGGMYIAHTDPELTNVTIAGNSAAFGGAITYNNSSNNMTITNSVIWGNSSGINTPGGGAPSIFYSLVQGNGGTTGTGNLDGTNTGNEPDFVNPIMASAAPTSFGDYQLQPGSPVINKGDDNNYLTARGISNFTGETDLAGESRQTGAKIDMGAYEKQ